MNYQQFNSILTLLALIGGPVEAFRRHPSFFDQHSYNDSSHDAAAAAANQNRRQLNNSESYTTSTSTSTSSNDNNHNSDQAKHDSSIKTKQETIQSTVDHVYEKTNKRNTLSLPQPSDHLVTDLPYLDPNALPTKQYAGHISASPDGVDDKKLFYWLFEPDTSLYDDGQEIPLLIWLNGGPGCSSMDGLFLENGPLQLVKDKTKNSWSIQINEYSWHKAPAYVLYVDQPVGTGLSFTKKRNYCNNDLEVDIDFHKFLENFLIMYQDFFLQNEERGQRKMKRPMFFSGESHAGHYIPSMIDHILQRNDDPSEANAPKVIMNVRGAAIGNGWVDPYYQYAAADLAYSIGMIDLAQKEMFDEKEEICREKLEGGNFRSGVCFDLLDDIVAQSAGKLGTTKVSIYDNRNWEKAHQDRSFPPGHKQVEAYLGGWNQANEGMTVDYKEVLKAIHAEESIDANQRYKECTDPPYNALSHQDGLGVTNEVVRILEHDTKPKLLFFNGMNDMICNHIGNEKFLDNLKWKHAKDWTLATRNVWSFESDFISRTENVPHGPAGYVKEYENLIFLKVASSGHMVPMDLPDTALVMIRTLMFDLSFGSNSQRLQSKMPHSDDTSECPSCPSCKSTTSPNGVDGADDYYNEGDDDGEEADESRVLFTKQFVTGGWFGAIVGVSLMFVVNLWRSRRSPNYPVKSSPIQTTEDNFEYADDPETELVMRSSRRSTAGGEFI